MSDIESGSRRPASDPVGRPGEWSPGTLRIALLGDEAEPKADGPLASLDRLGDPVELLQVRDPRSCLALCGRRDLDLVLVDRAPLGRVQELLAGLAGGGPPLVWLVEDGPEADRLAQAGFRAGAADVVRAAGPDDDTLAVVVLEQIRRHRQSAQQGAAERHIAWLERLNDAVVEALPTALAVVDGRRRVIAVNPEFSRVFGVDPEAASGRPIEGLLPGGLAESAELPRLLAEAAAGRPAAPRLGRWTDASGQRCVDLRVRSLDGEGGCCWPCPR